MARGKTVDRELVELILQMKERNPKLTTEQIGAVMNCDASTAGKIIKCGSWEGYCRFKDEKARKEREKASKAKPEGSLTIDAEKVNIPESDLPGQIRMDLDPEEEILDQKPEMSEPVKMMRFQAAQVDKIIMKLNQMNDTMNMMLRAIRRE